MEAGLKLFVTPRRFRVVPEKPLVGDFDEEARVRAVPDSITTKGMYFDALMAQLGERDVQAVWSTLKKAPRHGKYQPFLDYPFADALRWLHAVGHKRYPSLPLLEALRRIGRDTVKVFLESKAGRVVKTMTVGPRESLLRMPKMWKATDPQNVISAVEPEPDTVRIDIEGFPGWLDCGVIGTLEQVVMNHHHAPELDVELLGLAKGNITVRWR